MGASKRMKEQMDADFDDKVALAQVYLTKADNGDSVQSSLLAIQLGLKAPKDNVNNFAHFNYRTAGQILEKVKPFLAETGCILCVDDNLILIGDRYYVRSTVTLHHIATGGEIVSNGYAREGLTEKGKMDSQMTGSASTFAKKYALCNLFCIDDSAEDPDVTSGQEMQGPDRAQQAIMALNSARSADEVNNIKMYFSDVMSLPQVQQAGMNAKQRIGY